MRGRQGGQALAPEVGESDVDDPVVGRVEGALDEPGPFGPVDQLDRRVVAQEEVAGDVAHRGIAVVAPDGEEQLVLCGRDPSRLGLPFAPAQEVPEPVAEAEELGVLGVLEVHG